MLSVKKDLTETTSANMSFDPDWYVINDYELEEKIMRGFPNIEFVLDESGAVVDVKYTVQPPMTESERIEKNAADIAYVAMMTDVEIEE